MRIKEKSMEDAKQEFERKMEFIRRRYGLNTYEEVVEDRKRRGPLNVGVFVAPLRSAPEAERPKENA